MAENNLEQLVCSNAETAIAGQQFCSEKVCKYASDGFKGYEKIVLGCLCDITAYRAFIQTRRKESN